MKVEVYFVYVKGRWILNMSLDMTIDVRWWSNGGAAELWKLRRPVSLGQAVFWREVWESVMDEGNTNASGGVRNVADNRIGAAAARLEGAIKRYSRIAASVKHSVRGVAGHRAMTQDSSNYADHRAMSQGSSNPFCNSGTIATASDLASESSMWERLGVSFDMLTEGDQVKSAVENMENTCNERPGCRSSRLVGVMENVEEGENAKKAEKAEKADEQMSQLNLELRRMLAGRSLLTDEFLAMAEAGGLPLADCWKPMIQYLFLKGSVQLTSGVAFGIRRSVWGWKVEADYRCRRCGSGADKLAWTDCTSCGERCAYCEACLTMGRSRWCSLLIRSSDGGRASVECAPGQGEVQLQRKGQESGKAQQEGHNREPGQGQRLASGQEQRRGGEIGLAPLESNEAIHTRLQRWKLSPAQLDASAAGVQFLYSAAPKTGGKGDRSRDAEAASVDHRSGLSFLLKSIWGKIFPLKLDVSQGRLFRICRSSFRTRSRQRSLGDSANGREVIAPRGFLIWAVTGAGKTEMIYPLIETELLRKGRVLVATPRRDVVLELLPRMKKAFPEAGLIALYGGSEQRWEAGDITLATTHQLLRFWRRFDLVIIDEIDALPNMIICT